MKLIIAGSRHITDKELVFHHIDKACEMVSLLGENVTNIFSGGARGVDTIGELYAAENNIPVTIFPAQWDLYGLRAGYIRNEEMAKQGNMLLAIWDGESKGTKHMIDLANKHELVVHIVDYTRNDKR